MSLCPKNRRIGAGLALGLWLIASVGAAQDLGESQKPVPRPELSSSETRTTSGPIVSEPLGATSRDAIGLLPPGTSGFPRDLWGASSALRIATLMRRIEARGVPAARRLLHRLLLAETVPPRAASDRARVLLARIDTLIAIGAIDEAEALIERAGQPDRATFARSFDIALLTGRADRACGFIAIDPSLSPSFSADVYCAVRARDEAGADAALAAGLASGEITSNREAHLRLLMTPEAFPEGYALPVPTPYTALDHALRDATGQPRPQRDLAPAFLFADIDRRAPLRDRVLSAERLTRAGDFPYPLLFNLYRARPPAASGGVWDRIAAVQALDAALAEGADFTGELAEADRQLAAVRLRASMAQAYASRLEARSPPVEGSALVSELLLLDGRFSVAESWAPAEISEELAIALSIANNRPLPLSAGSITALRGLAALSALNGETNPSVERKRMRDLIAVDKRGEAILNALLMLDAGAEIDPGDLAIALDALVLTGRSEDARRIAIETLLLSR
ncbi:MAG: hypothetical protein AAFQ36_10840 [Pseudomonadota bacterium]